MSKTLVMNFLTDQGRKVAIRLKEVKADIDEISVGTTMDTIIEKNIFATTSGNIQIKDSAQIIDTTIENLSI